MRTKTNLLNKYQLEWEMTLHTENPAHWERSALAVEALRREYPDAKRPGDICLDEAKSFRAKSASSANYCSRFWNWMIDKGYAQSNPFSTVVKKKEYFLDWEYD